MIRPPIIVIEGPEFGDPVPIIYESLEHLSAHLEAADIALNTAFDANGDEYALVANEFEMAAVDDSHILRTAREELRGRLIEALGFVNQTVPTDTDFDEVVRIATLQFGFTPPQNKGCGFEVLTLPWTAIRRWLFRP